MLWSLWHVLSVVPQHSIISKLCIVLVSNRNSLVETLGSRCCVWIVICALLIICISPYYFYTGDIIQADENLRLIRTSLAEAVEACIDAAGHEFDLSRQRTLLRAASYGRAFCRLVPAEAIFSLKSGRYLSFYIIYVIFLECFLWVSLFFCSCVFIVGGELWRNNKVAAVLLIGHEFESWK